MKVRLGEGVVDWAEIPVVFKSVPSVSSEAHTLFPLEMAKSFVPSLCHPNVLALPGAAVQGLVRVASEPKEGASNGYGITLYVALATTLGLSGRLNPLLTVVPNSGTQYD